MGSRSETQVTPVEVTDDEAALFAMQLASFSVLPMVLKTALHLDIFEIMAKNPSVPMSPSDIVHHFSTNKNPDAPVMLERILRLLTSYSILTCSKRTLPGGDDEIRVYGLGKVCQYLLKSEDDGSIAPLCLMNQDKVLMESWHRLKDAILEGGVPFDLAHEGYHLFKYNGRDPRFNTVFNNGMSNHSTITMNKILETYTGFEGLTSLVDVGGGIGAALRIITLKYPNLKGINFDRPHVIKNAQPHPRIEHVEGDFLEKVPKGDAIFMKWICHDWSDENCLKILKNCYKVLPDDGKVILAECILPEIPDSSLLTKQTTHLDCIMLTHNPGGKERTRKEFKALAITAGFKDIEVTCEAFGVNIIELLKQI